MGLFRGQSALRKARRILGVSGVVAAAGLTLAACDPNSRPNVAAVDTRGATVAFSSIDGLPEGQFHTLVQDLNTEAQTRRLTITSRAQPSAYRVRGYLAATVDDGKTTIDWVWDVFDRDQHRALRISGSETAKAGDGWQAADNAMLQRIAHTSMGELAAFLTAPAVAPGAVPAPASQTIAFAAPDVTTPESAGIVPLPSSETDPATMPTAATTAAAVPLPDRRPAPGSVVARMNKGDTITLAAARR